MINKNRKSVAAPPSLDINLAAVIAELECNQKIVTACDIANTPWKDYKAMLNFKIYGANDDVKISLSKLFGNKCAYCEKSLDGQDLHTEHYRPKGEVSAIDDPAERGYWWLAATWENLLPACLHCNRSPGTDYTTGLNYGSGKKIRFPLVPLSKKANFPQPVTVESPVLINPTEDEPSDYFTFKLLNNLSFATINHLPTYAKQLRAMGSIEIYGLNNDALVRMRTEHLRNVGMAVRAYIRASIDFNSAISDGKTEELCNEQKDEVNKALDELYTRFLLPDKSFLHATVRYIESELRAVNLRLKDLLLGKDLYLPTNNLI